jgi:hypothetical protein
MNSPKRKSDNITASYMKNTTLFKFNATDEA